MQHRGRSEQQYREYRDLVENTSDWAWQVDPVGRYTYSNPKVFDLLGYMPKEVIGKTPFDFMPTGVADDIRKYFEKIAEARKPFYGLVNVNLHKNGQAVVLETNGVPIFDRNCTFLGYRGIDRDITERKKMADAIVKMQQELESIVEQRTAELLRINEQLASEIRVRKEIEADLRRSEQRFRSLVEAMNEGLAIQDDSGRLTYVNAKILEMTGYSLEEMIGRPVTDFMDEKNAKIYQRESAARSAGAAEAYELAFKTKTDNRIDTIVAPKALFESGNRYKGSFAVITDVSRLKKTEAVLKSRERQLSEKTRRLQKMNTALEVLLQKREQDRLEIEKKVLLNVRQFIEPYLDKLDKARLSAHQRELVNMLKINLSEIFSPFSSKLLKMTSDLTSMELKVAQLVKEGKRSKEIAALLNISMKTVDAHRLRIRKKLGLTQKKVNLETFLKSAD
jgi:PAS domain S-box-containing protein